MEDSDPAVPRGRRALCLETPPVGEGDLRTHHLASAAATKLLQLCPTLFTLSLLICKMGRSMPLYQGFCEVSREPQGKLKGEGRGSSSQRGLTTLRSGSCQGDSESPGFMGPQTVLTHRTGLGPTRVHTHSPSLSANECAHTWTHHSLPGWQAWHGSYQRCDLGQCDLGSDP